jgi:hypothetical protein
MKYLVFGSAWYIEDWCEENNSHFHGPCLVAINNSAQVVSRHFKLHRWYVGTDFFILKHQRDPEFDIHSYSNNYLHGYPSVISGDFLTRPYGYSDPMGGTMLLNVCYDLLNKAMLRHEKCTIGVIGCDMVYTREKSHFYEGGTDDPLRVGESVLNGYLADLKRQFEFSHNEIFNLSDVDDTRLPFDKISIDEFSAT